MGYIKSVATERILSLSDLQTMIKEENAALSATIKKDLSDQIKTMVTRVESLTVIVNKNNELLNDRISAVEVINKALETNLAILQAEVASNTGNISSLKNQIETSGCSSNATLFKEVDERRARRGNILIFGVLEPTDVNKEVREASDRAVIGKICADLEIDTSPSIHFRIGKYSSALARPRSLKLSFTNAGITDLII